jgi:F-type H+-transporting ATPase subunit b
MSSSDVLVASNALIKVTPGLMIWTIVAFLITLYVLKRWAFGPIQKTIDERRERIHQSIAEADHAREEARKLLEEHKALIAQARQEAEKIRQEVRADAESMRERVREETEADRQRRLDETRRQIEAETARSLNTIRQEIAELTLIAVSKVTGKVLDAGDQRRLIDEAIGSLDFSALEEKETA